MQRPVCVLLLLFAASGVVIAACGTIEDEGLVCTEEGDECGRPLDLDYMTAAIFAPSCGQAQCHSSFHAAGGRAFDTPEAARVSLLQEDEPLLQFGVEPYDPLIELRENNEDHPELINWLLPLNNTNKAVGRMPFDAPLPERDIELLKIWIRAPVMLTDGTMRAGGIAKGAQCNPDNYDGLACDNYDIVTCRPDFMFGEPVETCPDGCEIKCDLDPASPPNMPTCLEPVHRFAQCRVKP